MNDSTLPLVKRPMTHVSASQIQLFRDCPRKWYVTYVLGHFQPSTPSQILGQDVHTVAENWLKHGLVPPDTKAGKIFSRGIPHLPPGQECVVEGEFLMEDTEVPLKGFIDVIHQNGPDVFVIDHKTTASKRWMKTPPELAKNTQMVIYAKWVLEQRFPDHNEVTLQHDYYGTRSAFFEQVRVKVTRDTIEQIWKGIEITISEMVNTHNQSEEDVLQRLTSCSAYGGCAFQSRCGTGEKTLAERLIDKLLQQKAAKTSQPETKPQPAAPKSAETTVLQAINPPDEEVVPVTEPELEDLSQEKPVKKRASRAKAPPPRVLYIKCLPSKDMTKQFGAPVSYSDLIKEHTEALCQQYDAPHISLVGSYADGYKHLAAMVAQQGWPEEHSAIYINPMRSKGSDYVLDVLIALADVVIEGT